MFRFSRERPPEGLTVYDRGVRELLVVGGGIGSLATALSAARTGRRVHVIEKARPYLADPSASRFERPFGEWRDALFI